MMSLTVLLLFALTMTMGVPIAFAMGVSAATVIWWNDFPLTVLAQRTINALDSVPLLAVPMFIFAAALFNAAGITRHLFDLIRLAAASSSACRPCFCCFPRWRRPPSVRSSHPAFR